MTGLLRKFIKKHALISIYFQGKFSSVWNDKGSKASKDVSLWEIVAGNDSNAIEGNNFQATSGFQKPSGFPKILKKTEKVQQSKK